MAPTVARIMLAAWVCAGLAIPSEAQDEEAVVFDQVAVDLVAPVAQADFELDVTVFDQWLYGDQFGANNGRKALDDQIELWIGAIDRVCQLTEAQTTKLRLAARGDVKKFMDEVELVRAKFMLVRRDQNRVNEIYQEIQPLQARLRGGLFGDKSLMQKVVINTLDGEQSQRWEQELAQRRRFQYEAKVEFIVAALGQSLALNAKQREQLIRVLLEETQAPVRSGAYEFYVLMHQLSKLPAARLEPLFDDAQWEAMKEQLQQAKGLEPFLKAQGILE